MSHRLHDLPAVRINSDSRAIASAIAKQFDSLRYRCDSGENEQLRTAQLVSNLSRIISEGRPINFLLPAFPFKSTNTIYKVLGKLPDKAEELALRHLHAFCKDASLVHPPGVTITVFSDGHVYGDIVGVHPEDFAAYCTSLKEMYLKICAGNPRVYFHGLEDAFPNAQGSEGELLVEQFGKPMRSIEGLIAQNEDTRSIYCAFSRFLKEELSAHAGIISKNAFLKHCKQKAKQMIQRSNAFSCLLEELFPQHLRLSIHAHMVHVEKLPVSLVYAQDRLRTPWHNVAVQGSDGGFQLMWKKDAEERGYTLVRVGETPSHYVQPEVAS